MVASGSSRRAMTDDRGSRIKDQGSRIKDQGSRKVGGCLTMEMCTATRTARVAWVQIVSAQPGGWFRPNMTGRCGDINCPNFTKGHVTPSPPHPRTHLLNNELSTTSEPPPSLAARIVNHGPPPQAHFTTLTAVSNPPPSLASVALSRDKCIARPQHRQVRGTTRRGPAPVLVLERARSAAPRHGQQQDLARARARARRPRGTPRPGESLTTQQQRQQQRQKRRKRIQTGRSWQQSCVCWNA